LIGDSTYCLNCGRGIAEKNRELMKIPRNGEIVDLKCAICGKELRGNAWDSLGSADILNLVGIACSNCGFAICNSGHGKEKRALGIKRIGASACPTCGMLMSIENGNYRAVFKVKEERHEPESGEGRCATCGADAPLQEKTIWSGVEVTGECISPAIRWMVLIELAPAKYKTTIENVQSKAFQVCKKCSRSSRPHTLVKNERVRKEGIEVVTQGFPFTKEQLGNNT
jgi:DNA-directed RNA polymerase subunit RPC12/RpoP